MAVQVSYYNECLAAWEPLLEPVIVEDEKTMWKVQVKVTIRDVTASICNQMQSVRNYYSDVTTKRLAWNHGTFRDYLGFWR